MKNTVKLIISIAIPLAVGAAAAFFTTPEIPGWFQSIRKPSWNPPNWVFAPVWTTLYLMMGLSLFLVWRSNVIVALKNRAITFFIVQLVLNFFWSFIFFHEHQIAWALGDIMALWLFILLTIFAFGTISRPAAWLLVPYIAWVSFAMMLNYAIWRLNGG